MSAAAKHKPADSLRARATQVCAVTDPVNHIDRAHPESACLGRHLGLVGVGSG